MPDNLRVSGLKLDSSDLKRGVSEAERELTRLDRRIRRLEGETDSASRSMKGYGVAIAGAAAAFAAFRGAQSAARFIFETNVEFQKLEATLKTVTGSAEAGAAAFQLITDFAKTTPFEVAGLTQAFIGLRVRGFDPTREQLKGLGNFAAAFTADITDLSAAIVSASAGMTRPLRRFGVDASKEGDKIAISFQGVKKTVALSAEAISAALAEIGNTKFPTAMSERMATLDGQLSNLSDITHLLARDIGRAGLNGEIIALVGTFQEAVSEGNKFADTLGHTLASGVHVADNALQVLIRHIDTIIAATEVLAGAALARTLVAIGSAAAGASVAVGGLGAALLRLAGGPVGAVVTLTAALGIGLSKALDAVRGRVQDLSTDFERVRDASRTFTDAELAGKVRALGEQLATFQARAEKLRASLGTNVRQGTILPGKVIALETPEQIAAAKELRDLQLRINRLFELRADLAEKLGKRAAAGAKKEADAAEVSVSAAQKIIDGLEEERRQLALTDRQLLLFKLDQAGATEQQKLHALAIWSSARALEAQQAAAEDAGSALERYAERRDKGIDVGFSRTGPLQQAIKEQQAAIEAQRTQLAAWDEQIRRTSDRMAGAVSDAFLKVIDGTGSVVDAFRSMVDEILAEMLRLTIQQTITQPLANLLSAALTSALSGGGGGGAAPSGKKLSGGGGFAGFGAAGGTVPSGKFAIVGERGPEIVTGPAEVTPIRSGGGASSAGAAPVQVHQNITFAPSFLDAAHADAWLRRRAPTVLRVMKEGAKRSTSLRRTLVTGQG